MMMNEQRREIEFFFVETLKLYDGIGIDEQFARVYIPMKGRYV